MEFNFRSFNRTEHQFFKKMQYLIVDNCYDPYCRNRYLKYINENEIKAIYSQDYDLSYLSECPSVEAVIADRESNRLEALYSLKRLKMLALSTDDEKFDYTKLSSELTFLFMQGDSKNKSWLDLSSLKGLSFSDYSQKDLSLMEKFQGKDELSFFEIDCSFAKFLSLNGLSNFSHLKSLILSYCRKLKDFSELTKCKEIEELLLYDDPHVDDFDFSQLVTLKKFHLYDKETVRKKKALPSISFLDAMPLLEEFETDRIILDGGVKRLLKLREAKLYTWKSFYNIKKNNPMNPLNQ